MKTLLAVAVLVMSGCSPEGGLSTASGGSYHQLPAYQLPTRTYNPPAQYQPPQPGYHRYDYDRYPLDP